MPAGGSVAELIFPISSGFSMWAASRAICVRCRLGLLQSRMRATSASLGLGISLGSQKSMLLDVIHSDAGSMLVLWLTLYCRAPGQVAMFLELHTKCACAPCPMSVQCDHREGQREGRRPRARADVPF